MASSPGYNAIRCIGSAWARSVAGILSRGGRNVSGLRFDGQTLKVTICNSLKRTYTKYSTADLTQPLKAASNSLSGRWGVGWGGGSPRGGEARRRVIAATHRRRLMGAGAEARCTCTVHTARVPGPLGE